MKSSTMRIVGSNWRKAWVGTSSVIFSCIIRAIKARTRGMKSLLQEFPEQVLNTYLPDDGRGFIREVLEPYARADIRLLAQDFQGEDPHWEQVNHWLKRLDQLDNDDWRPPALWALIRAR